MFTFCAEKVKDAGFFGSPLFPFLVPSMPLSSSCPPGSSVGPLSAGLQLRVEGSTVLCLDILSLGCGNQKWQEVTDTTSQLSQQLKSSNPQPQNPHRSSPQETAVNLVSWPQGMRIWAKVCNNITAELSNTNNKAAFQRLPAFQSCFADVFEHFRWELLETETGSKNKLVLLSFCIYLWLYYYYVLHSYNGFKFIFELLCT